MPCSLTAVTGELANVVVGSTRLKRITGWTVNPSDSGTAWGDSDGGGFTLRRGGRRDASITIEGKYDSGRPIESVFEEGTFANPLVLWQDASRYWYFDCAKCESFQYQFNSDTMEVVSWTSTWAPDGIFYDPDDANLPASSLPAS